MGRDRSDETQIGTDGTDATDGNMGRRLVVPYSIRPICLVRPICVSSDLNARRRRGRAWPDGKARRVLRRVVNLRQPLEMRR